MTNALKNGQKLKLHMVKVFTDSLTAIVLLEKQAFHASIKFPEAQDDSEKAKTD